MQKRIDIFRNPDYRPEFRVKNLYIKFPVLCIQVLGLTHYRNRTCKFEISTAPTEVKSLEGSSLSKVVNQSKTTGRGMGAHRIFSRGVQTQRLVKRVVGLHCRSCLSRQ